MNGALSPEDVREILEANRHVEEICFTSGEPTLVGELPRYVAWARDLRFPRISLSTNGRRLSYDSYCDELIRAGIGRFYVSIHGHNARLHDGLVRTPGAFAQTLSGLRNVARRANSGLELHACTVINRRNLPYLPEMYRFLRDNGADQVVFNVMQANGRAHIYFEKIFPRYTDIADAYARFLEGLPEASPPTFLVDIPRCVTAGIPADNRGWVESYFHHEVAVEPHGDGDVFGSFAAGPGVRERSRSEFDRACRRKGPRCSRCVYDDSCEGVWKNYLDRHGWDEFEPVTGSAARPGASPLPGPGPGNR